MALLLGGFILIGIEPGLNMVTDQLDLVYIIIWSVALANIIGAGTCLLLAGPIARLTTIRYSLIAPFMFGIIFFAAFQATREWGDLIALLIIGALGIYMKRFGWPRPALLIGFVLSDKVEASIYHTFQVYKFTFLERPIVLVLAVLIVLSIFAALRYKGGSTEPSPKGVHAANKLGPQTAFFFVVLIFALTVLGDGLRWQFLTGVYPITSGLLTLAFLVPLGIQMYRTKRASRVFYDSERGEFDADVDRRSNEHYILWLAGMLVASAVAGFVIGVSAFIYAFMRVKARVPHWACVLGATAFVLVLGTLSHFLTLEYPQGILQDYVTLPWPLQ